MTKENATKVQSMSNYVVMAGVLILVFVCVSIVYVDKTGQVSELKTQLDTSKLLTETLKRDVLTLKDKVTDAKKLLIEYQNNPVDTTGDALLQRDIFIYIDKKFQLIPRTASEDIAKQIIIKSRVGGVSPELIVGIIEVESGFNPSAVSSANARGLMQVMPEWAKKFGLKKVSDLHDIDTGIECGIKVLKIHIEEENHNLTRGLFKYVGGSDAYAGKVYKAMGKFVAYRSTIPDNNGKEETESSGSSEGTNKSN